MFSDFCPQAATWLLSYLIGREVCSRPALRRQIQKLGHLLGSQTKNRRRTAKSRSKVSPGSDLVFVARVRSVSALRFFILIVHRSSGVKAERRADAGARGSGWLRTTENAQAANRAERWARKASDQKTGRVQFTVLTSVPLIAAYWLLRNPVSGFVR